MGIGSKMTLALVIMETPVLMSFKTCSVLIFHDNN